MNSTEVPRFHLRRIGRPPSVAGVASFIHFDKVITLIGRNRDVVDYFISCSSLNYKDYISRTHARVIRILPLNTHKLVDSSLTGVYVNDVRIRDKVNLQEGDTVTFGHPKSVNIRPETRIRQPNSELYFLFECCLCQRHLSRSIADPSTGTSLLPAIQWPLMKYAEVPNLRNSNLALVKNIDFSVLSHPFWTCKTSNTSNLSMTFSTDCEMQGAETSVSLPSTSTMSTLHPINLCTKSRFGASCISGMPEKSMSPTTPNSSKSSGMSRSEIFCSGSPEYEHPCSSPFTLYPAKDNTVLPTDGRSLSPVTDTPSQNRSEMGKSKNVLLHHEVFVSAGAFVDKGTLGEGEDTEPSVQLCDDSSDQSVECNSPNYDADHVKLVMDSPSEKLPTLCKFKPGCKLGHQQVADAKSFLVNGRYEKDDSEHCQQLVGHSLEVSAKCISANRARDGTGLFQTGETAGCLPDAHLLALCSPDEVIKTDMKVEVNSNSLECKLNKVHVETSLEGSETNIKRTAALVINDNKSLHNGTQCMCSSVTELSESMELMEGTSARHLESGISEGKTCPTSAKIKPLSTELSTLAQGNGTASAEPWCPEKDGVENITSTSTMQTEHRVTDILSQEVLMDTSENSASKAYETCNLGVQGSSSMSNYLWITSGLDANGDQEKDKNYFDMNKLCASKETEEITVYKSIYISKTNEVDSAAEYFCHTKNHHGYKDEICTVQFSSASDEEEMKVDVKESAESSTMHAFVETSKLTEELTCQEKKDPVKIDSFLPHIGPSSSDSVKGTFIEESQCSIAVPDLESPTADYSLNKEHLNCSQALSEPACVTFSIPSERTMQESTLRSEHSEEIRATKMEATVPKSEENYFKSEFCHDKNTSELTSVPDCLCAPQYNDPLPEEHSLSDVVDCHINIRTHFRHSSALDDYPVREEELASMPVEDSPLPDRLTKCLASPMPSDVCEAESVVEAKSALIEAELATTVDCIGVASETERDVRAIQVKNDKGTNISDIRSKIEQESTKIVKEQSSFDPSLVDCCGKNERSCSVSVQNVLNEYLLEDQLEKRNDALIDTVVTNDKIPVSYLSVAVTDSADKSHITGQCTERFLSVSVTRIEHPPCSPYLDASVPEINCPVSCEESSQVCVVSLASDSLNTLVPEDELTELSLCGSYNVPNIQNSTVTMPVNPGDQTTIEGSNELQNGKDFVVAESEALAAEQLMQEINLDLSSAKDSSTDTVVDENMAVIYCRLKSKREETGREVKQREDLNNQVDMEDEAHAGVNNGVEWENQRECKDDWEPQANEGSEEENQRECNECETIEVDNHEDEVRKENLFEDLDNVDKGCVSGKKSKNHQVSQNERGDIESMDCACAHEINGIVEESEHQVHKESDTELEKDLKSIDHACELEVGKTFVERECQGYENGDIQEIHFISIDHTCGHKVGTLCENHSLDEGNASSDMPSGDSDHVTESPDMPHLIGKKASDTTAQPHLVHNLMESGKQNNIQGKVEQGNLPYNSLALCSPDESVNDSLRNDMITLSSENAAGCLTIVSSSCMNYSRLDSSILDDAANVDETHASGLYESFSDDDLRLHFSDSECVEDDSNESHLENEPLNYEKASRSQHTICLNTKNAVLIDLENSERLYISKPELVCVDLNSESFQVPTDCIEILPKIQVEESSKQSSTLDKQVENENNFAHSVEKGDILGLSSRVLQHVIDDIDDEDTLTELKNVQNGNVDICNLSEFISQPKPLEVKNEISQILTETGEDSNKVCSLSLVSRPLCDPVMTGSGDEATTVHLLECTISKQDLSTSDTHQASIEAIGSPLTVLGSDLCFKDSDPGPVCPKGTFRSALQETNESGFIELESQDSLLKVAEDSSESCEIEDAQYVAAKSMTELAEKSPKFSLKANTQESVIGIKKSKRTFKEASCTEGEPCPSKKSRPLSPSSEHIFSSPQANLIAAQNDSSEFRAELLGNLVRQFFKHLHCTQKAKLSHKKKLIVHRHRVQWARLVALLVQNFFINYQSSSDRIVDDHLENGEFIQCTDNDVPKDVRLPIEDSKVISLLCEHTEEGVPVQPDLHDRQTDVFSTSIEKAPVPIPCRNRDIAEEVDALSLISEIDITSSAETEKKNQQQHNSVIVAEHGSFLDIPVKTWSPSNVDIEMKDDTFEENGKRDQNTIGSESHDHLVFSQCFFQGNLKEIVSSPPPKQKVIDGASVIMANVEGVVSQEKSQINSFENWSSREMHVEEPTKETSSSVSVDCCINLMDARENFLCVPKNSTLACNDPVCSTTGKPFGVNTPVEDLHVSTLITEDKTSVMLQIDNSSSDVISYKRELNKFNLCASEAIYHVERLVEATDISTLSQVFVETDRTENSEECAFNYDESRNFLRGKQSQNHKLETLDTSFLFQIKEISELKNGGKKDKVIDPDETKCTNANEAQWSESQLEIVDAAVIPLDRELKQTHFEDTCLTIKEAGVSLHPEERMTNGHRAVTKVEIHYADTPVQVNITNAKEIYVPRNEMENEIPVEESLIV